MRAIVVKEEKDGIEDGDVVLFHQLQTLVLEDLPELVSFLSTRSSFTTDCGQIIEEGNHDLHMPLLHYQLSFPSLKELHLQHLPKIKHVWSNVNGCESLKSLYIRDCGVLEEIVEREDGIDPTSTRLLFASLTLLSLNGLPKLKWFFQRVRTLESSSSKELHEQGGTLFGVEELSFPSLKTLRLEGLPRIKHVWSKEIFRFPNLLNLYVAGCENLKSLFPAAVVATSLTQLKSLEISYCGVLEEIVQREYEIDPTSTRLLFPSLTLLRLDGLPKLKWFFQGVHTLESSSSKELHEQGGTLFGVDEVAFPKLTNLCLWNLPKIKHVWSKDPQTILNLQTIDVSKCASLKSLFPTSIGTRLKQLKELRINDCGELEEIVEAEGGEAMGRMLEFEFPQVIYLGLKNLPRLECFYKGLHISKWPMLKMMFIDECEKVEVLFASGLVSKETVEESQIKQPLFLVDETPIPSLEILKISKMEKLEIIWNIKDSHQRYMYNFPKLLHIDVSLCESLKSLFPAASVAASLKKLESLIITGCGVLEEIVEREDGTDPTTRLSFPCLICLGLYGLPKLKWFLQGVHTLETSSSKELHEQEGTLFVVEEVDFPSLKLLDLYGLPKIKHVWSKDSQTISSFQNLQVIIVGKCVSLKSMFPASIVRCLEQLEKIKIYDCGVEEIVATEGGEAVEMTLVFPQVTSLCLENLGRLEGVHDSKWSMLKEMRILECEKVKLSFPSLATLEIRRMYKLEIKSRNVPIRKLWRSCYARCLHHKESYRLQSALMEEYIYMIDYIF